MIEGFENYEISNYGRIKSLKRITISQRSQREEPEKIMKLLYVKYLNKYLNRSYYNIFCSLSLNSAKYRKSVARLVYYHFVKKYDMDNRSVVISYKDSNSFHLHYNNLELLSISEQRYKMFKKDRARSWKSDHQQPISQYTIEGDFVASFDSIYAAIKHLVLVVAVSCMYYREKILQQVGFDGFIKSTNLKWKTLYLPQKIGKDQQGQMTFLTSTFGRCWASL